MVVLTMDAFLFRCLLLIDRKCANRHPTQAILFHLLVYEL